MADDFYKEMQGIASNLLKEFDQTPSGVTPSPASGGNGIYYIRVTPGAGRADAPGPSIETPFKLDAVARGVAFKYIDGANVVQTDLQTTHAVHADFKPKIGDFIIVDGVRHKIIQVINKPAAGTPVAHTIIFRK